MKKSLKFNTPELGFLNNKDLFIQLKVHELG